MDISDLHTRFINEKDGNQSMQEIRPSLYNVAILLNVLLPEGREKSLAITRLEEVMFWAYASLNRAK